MQRVQKILSNNGFCSRRKAEDLINQGRVRVNHKTISIGDKASSEDDISVDGKIIKKISRVYVIFNKPVKCVTALNDPKYKTIMDYISLKERIFPVGRLDYNTSGLLLLTNDGDFANKVAHPSHGSMKLYRVVLQQKLLKSDIKKIRNGIKLDDGLAKADVKKVTDYSAKVFIHIGRNRIVRRIFKHLGYNIKTLHREGIGGLKLDCLAEGKYKVIKKKVAEKALAEFNKKDNK
ncbi:MAG: pseudouridine synthase [Nanobdellota archaeon]